MPIFDNTCAIAADARFHKNKWYADGNSAFCQPIPKNLLKNISLTEEQPIWIAFDKNKIIHIQTTPFKKEQLTTKEYDRVQTYLNMLKSKGIYTPQ